MENNEKEIEKKETVSAEIFRDQHKLVKKLAIDVDKNIQDVYAEIIPLGIAQYVKNNSLTVQPS